MKEIMKSKNQWKGKQINKRENEQVQELILWKGSFEKINNKPSGDSSQEKARKHRLQISWMKE